MPATKRSALKRPAVERLQHFAAVVLLEHHRTVHVTDAKLQDLAIMSGVLEWVRATEACGSDCFCASAATFPQDCLRHPDDVAAILADVFGDADSRRYLPAFRTSEEIALGRRRGR